MRVVLLGWALVMVFCSGSPAESQAMVPAGSGAVGRRALSSLLDRELGSLSFPWHPSISGSHRGLVESNERAEALAKGEAPPDPVAEEQPPELGVPRGRFRFLWENDSWFTESDRFYTNGIGVGWTFADSRFTRAVNRALSWLPFSPENPSGRATELFFRQDMFTPEDFTNPNLVPDDRPYAGWLHLDFTHQILTLDKEERHDRLDTWQLEIGVVGPSSLAEQAQREVHELVDAPEPRGWRHQLKDEPGIVLGYRRDFRAYFNRESFAPCEADFIGHFGVRLGNVDTSIRLGGEVSFGFNLSRHFGTALRGPQIPQRHRFYLAAGVEGRFVPQNIFLDGNTYRRSHSVDRNKLVADFHVGVHWEPCQRLRLSVSEVFTTPEFDSPSQDGDVGHHTAVQVELFF